MDSTSFDMEAKEMVVVADRNENEFISLDPLRRLVVALVPTRVSS